MNAKHELVQFQTAHLIAHLSTVVLVEQQFT